MKLILASTSSRRKELLKVFRIPFETRSPSDVEESALTPGGIHTIAEYRRIAGKISRIKAESVASTSGDDSLIIAADTMVILEGMSLGKPVDIEDAAGMLRSLSGKSHHVITGVTLMRIGELTVTDAEVTRVTFKPLTDEEIFGYIRTGEPMDKAGAYGIQGIAGALITDIEGCYYNVVGLPLSKLYRMLYDFGVRIFAQAKGSP
jgi:septum formation protein